MSESVVAECSACDATGLYQGFCEKRGAAVICTRCEGTGKVTIDYIPFTERKIKENVKRIFKSSFMYYHAAEDVVTEEGDPINFTQGGCTYQEWLDGVEPKPVKELYCPYLWDRKGVESCEKNLEWGKDIKDCKYYPCKEECWEIWEEHKK